MLYRVVMLRGRDWPESGFHKDNNVTDCLGLKLQACMCMELNKDEMDDARRLTLLLSKISMTYDIEYKI